MINHDFFFILTSFGHLSHKSNLLILVISAEQAEVFLELSQSVHSLFFLPLKNTIPCHILLAASVSGPFIALVLVFLWCLGELVWLIKPAYYCVFLYSDCFLLLGLLFFTLMSSLQAQ